MSNLVRAWGFSIPINPKHPPPFSSLSPFLLPTLNFLGMGWGMEEASPPPPCPIAIPMNVYMIVIETLSSLGTRIFFWVISFGYHGHLGCLMRFNLFWNSWLGISSSHPDSRLLIYQQFHPFPILVPPYWCFLWCYCFLCLSSSMII